jgi:HlyD family secretion protein
MTKRKKLYIGGGIGLLVVLGAVGAFAAGGDKSTTVRIEPVERRDIVESVTASGQVEPRTKVDISADITGRIVRLAVQEGQEVARGQFLLQIDPSQYQAAAERAAAALSNARSQAQQAQVNLTQAQRNYNRMEELKRAHPTLISDEQIEQVRTQMELAQAARQAAQFAVAQSAASLRDAQSSLAKTTLVAPMSGKVTRLRVEEGETAIMGTLNKDAATLLTISDMSVLQTKVKVDETDVSRISLGDSADVEIDAFPDTTFLGRVVRVSHSSVRTTGQMGQATDQAIDYEVIIELLNPPPLTRPDFSATARIVTDTRRGALSIPIIALTVREDSAARTADTVVTLGRPAPRRQVGRRDVEGVFIVDADGKASFRPVRVGIAGDRYFEVVSGLEEGDRIVAGTYQAIRELKDGTRVRESPAAQGTPATATASAKSS